eukprot:scaffold1299_cov385-Pavlova_lutheri.AAC.21
MQLRRMRVEIARMRALAVVVTRQSPSLGLAFAAAFDAIATECDALLREMMGWWSPQCSLASTARTVDSFTDDELRSWFRFDREAISELRGLLHVLEVLRSLCKRWFGGEEAFLLLLRRLVGRERNMELAQIFGWPTPAILEMYNVMLDHVYEHAQRAMRLEMWEAQLPSFADDLARCECLEAHCVGFINGTIFTICRLVVG